MLVQATNKQTGEIIEHKVSDLSDAVIVWQIAQEYEKQAKDIKEQLKDYVRDNANDFGKADVDDSYSFTITSVQRTKFNKQMVREAIEDQDLLDELMIIDTKLLREKLKAWVAEGTITAELSAMIKAAEEPSGNPYEVIRLEKKTREAR